MTPARNLLIKSEETKQRIKMQLLPTIMNSHIGLNHTATAAVVTNNMTSEENFKQLDDSYLVCTIPNRRSNRIHVPLHQTMEDRPLANCWTNILTIRHSRVRVQDKLTHHCRLLRLTVKERRQIKTGRPSQAC